MTRVETAVQLARHELEHRTFAVTKQYLAQHTVLTGGDGLAAVARIDETSEVGAAHVYFCLSDVPYHCVVAVRPTPDRDLSIEGVAPAISALRPACSIEFVIVYSGWVGNSSLGGVQLTSHATQVLAQAGAALDVDIYAFGPPLTHTADEGEDA